MEAHRQRSHTIRPALGLHNVHFNPLESLIVEVLRAAVLLLVWGVDEDYSIRILFDVA